MRRTSRLAGLAAGMIGALAAGSSMSAPVAPVAVQQQGATVDRAVRQAPARQHAPTSTKTLAATATKRFMSQKRIRTGEVRWPWSRGDSWRVVKHGRRGAVAVLRSS